MTYEKSPLLVKALTQGTFLMAGVGVGSIVSKIAGLLI